MNEGVAATQAGFTSVEVIITVALAILFIGAVLVGLGYVSTQKEDVRRYTAASSIADSNLSKFKDSADVACSSSTMDDEYVLLNDDSDNRETPPDGVL